MSNRIKNIPTAALLITSFILPVSASSAQSTSRDISINGFGTLGVSHSDNNTYGWRPAMNQEGSFDGSWDLDNHSFLGLQLSTHLNSQWGATAQLVVRERSYGGAEDLLDWAYLSYQPGASVELRLGRTGLPIYLLSEYRAVRFAQPWAHPPVEFYGQLPQYFSDGLDLAYSHNTNAGVWKLRAGIGTSNLNLYVGDELEGSDGDTDIVELSPGYSLTLSFESIDWRAQVSASASKIEDRFRTTQRLYGIYQQLADFGLPGTAAIEDELAAQGAWIYYLASGAVFDDGQWIFQGELNRIEAEIGLINESWNGYLMAGHHFNAVTPYIVVSFSDSTAQRAEVPLFPIPGGDELKAMTEFLFDTVSTNQYTLAAGVRWDIHSQLALKVQWDSTRAKKDGLLLFGLSSLQPPQKDESINTLTLQLDFVF